MSRLIVRLLGPLQVWRGEQGLHESLHSQRAREVLAMLVGERDSYVPAERIIELVWPHLTPRAAANNLQATVRKLRRWLEPELKRGRRSRYLLTEPAGYRFHSESCDVDVDEFNDATQRGLGALRSANPAAALNALERARSLYRGDYLQELPYAEWAFARRLQLRELHLEGLAALGECYLQLGHYGLAATVADQALALDPLREGLARLVMKSYAAQDRRAEALTTYEDHARLLREELAVEPSIETRALRDAIWSGSFGIAGATAEGGPQPSIELPFAGREADLDSLRQAWLRRQRLVLISGEAGVGKTRLLREFVASLAGDADAPSVFWSGSQRGEAPYAAIMRWVESYLGQSPPAGELARLGPLGAPLAQRLPQLRRHWPGCPPYSALEHDAEEVRLRQALLAALRQAASSNTMFILDDLQWADEASLTLLHQFLDGAGPGCFLLAFRPEEEGAAAGLDGWPQVGSHKHSMLNLQPLRAVDVLSAVRAVIPLADPLPFSRRLFELTAGYPLYLTEMVHGLMDAGWLYQDTAGAWHAGDAILEADLSDLPLTATLRETLLLRAGRLMELQRDVLEAAAVLQTHITLPALSNMVQVGEARLRALLAALVARGWLRADGDDGWSFTHHLVREVVYGELAPSHRRLLHRLAARSLVAHVPAVPGEMSVVVTRHLRAGSSGATELASWALLAALWSLEQFAYPEAERYFELVQTLWTQFPEGEAKQALALRLYEGMALLLPRLGRSREALVQLEQALALATNPHERVRLLLAAARLCERDTGEYERALKWLAEAEALLEGSGSEQRVQRARLFTIQADVHYWSGRHHEAVQLARRAGAEAQGTIVEYDAFRALASSLHKMGELEEAIELYQRMLALAIEAGDLGRVAQAHLSQGNGFYAMGLLGAAHSAYEEAGAVIEKLGDRRALSIKMTNCGVVAFEMGALTRSERELREAVALAEKVGAPYTVAVARHHLGRVLTLRGRLNEAAVELEGAIELARSIGGHVIAAQAELHLALWQWAQDNLSAAELTATNVVAAGDELEDNFCRREGRLLLAMIALARGDVQAARTLALSARQIAAAAQQRLAIGRAERILAQAAAANGESVSSDEHLVKSEQLFRHSGAQIELAQTLMVRAEAAIHAGAAPDRYRSQLVEARRLFSAAGATLWLTRVDALLAPH